MVLICPDCGHENIDGIDQCEGCLQSLTTLNRPLPESPLAKSLIRDRISVLEPRQPVAVTSDTPVGETLQLLVDNHIGSVLVVDEGHLVGIFSERDALVRLNTEVASLRDQPISKYMTPTPVTLGLGDRIIFAVHKMALGGYRHVPIVEDGRPTGVISIRDILRYTTEKLQADAATES